VWFVAVCVALEPALAILTIRVDESPARISSIKESGVTTMSGTTAPPELTWDTADNDWNELVIEEIAFVFAFDESAKRNKTAYAIQKVASARFICDYLLIIANSLL
jgi:hypothetical protein